jgi:hypothetical protein
VFTFLKLSLKIDSTLKKQTTRRFKMKVKDKKSKVHSLSRGWEKALKKRGNKKQRQFDKKMIVKGEY